MTSFFQEFKTFALRGNAFDLAVGVVIGAAFNSVVTSLVTDILTPPIGLLMGGVDFSALYISLGGSAIITLGHFIQTLISFVITAFALFLVVKAMNNLARKEEAKSPTKSPELLVLEDIRESLKK